MNRVITLGMAALLATAGAAMAGEPMMLTDAELDRVTAGSVEEIIRAIQNDKFLGGFEFTDGTYVKSVPEGGFDRAAR